MATIGTFTSTGTIKTLNLNVKAKLVSIESPSDKGPHFRILAAGNVELGAAWQKVSKETERDYLSVKLDDLSFNTSKNCAPSCGTPFIASSAASFRRSLNWPLPSAR